MRIATISSMCLLLAFFPHVQAYFNLSPSSLRPVLKEAHNYTIRLILQYYASVKDTLQVNKTTTTTSAF